MAVELKELESRFQLEEEEDKDVIEKLHELTYTYHLEIGDLHDNWLAFLMTKEMDLNIKPTVMLAHVMQREVLAKKAAAVPKKNHKEPEPVFMADPSGIEDMMSMYNVKTPNRPSVGKKRQRSPDTIEKEAPLNVSMSVLRPEMYSPKSATPPRIFKDRKNAGECMLSFGNVSAAPWSDRGHNCYIDSFDSSFVLTNSLKYMFQKKVDQAEILNSQIEEMSTKLQDLYKLESFYHVALSTQETVTVAGRICCDSEGRLNAQSTVLEGSRETSAGKCIPLDLSELKEYSLFPGQIVAMDGINPTGKKFVVQKVYQGVGLQQPSLNDLPEGSSLNVMVAAGPFLTTDSIMFEPLTELLNMCQKEKPDICILMGPFLDEEHEGIQNLSGETYKKMFDRLCQGIQSVAEQLHCHMVLVPSRRDIHNTLIYPQPPFEYEKSRFMHFVADPSLLSINGVLFGISSTDVLFHISNSEICSNTTIATNRFKRMIRHLFAQQSFYPMYPSHDEVYVSFDHADYFQMPIKPHVLILPSQFRYFLMDVDDCFCINPGTLTKGESGGTFVKLNIHRTKADTNSFLIPDIAAKVMRV